jgi:hypothetical protein
LHRATRQPVVSSEGSKNGSQRVCHLCEPFRVRAPELRNFHAVAENQEPLGCLLPKKRTPGQETDLLIPLASHDVT